MPTAGKGISKPSPDLRRRSSDQNGAILLNTASVPIDDAHQNYNDDVYNQKIKPPGGARMKVSKDQFAEHRTKIMAAAASLFRQRGFDDVTVVEVMAAAGLTHGAFYRHFPSKEVLIAESVGQALPRAPDTAEPRRSAAEFADGYLSVRHRDNRANSCLFSSLGTEAARGSADLRHRMTKAMRHRINHLSAEAEGSTPEEKRRAASAAWAAMVGAMVLARLVDDDDLSKDILTATRASLPLS
jgi:TetR/AcrR family transcriptional repressor of nem operon